MQPAPLLRSAVRQQSLFAMPLGGTSIPRPFPEADAPIGNPNGQFNASLGGDPLE